MNNLIIVMVFSMAPILAAIIIDIGKFNKRIKDLEYKLYSQNIYFDSKMANGMQDFYKEVQTKNTDEVIRNVEGVNLIHKTVSNTELPTGKPITASTAPNKNNKSPRKK